MLFCKTLNINNFVAQFICFMFSIAIYSGLKFIQIKHYQPSIQQQCGQFSVGEKIVGIILVWIWFKVSHVFAYYQLIDTIQQRRPYLIPLFMASFLLITFLFDFPMHLYSKYTLWMFSGFYLVTILIVIIVQGILVNLPVNQLGILILNCFLMSLSYVLPAAYILLLNPIIFNAMKDNFNLTLTYAYIFPLISFILQIIVRIISKLAKQNVKPFISQAHWLLYGFRFGFLLRVNYYQPQFYYILVFIGIQNLILSFLNNFQFLDNSMQPPFFIIGWVGIFLLAYYFNYNPVSQLLGKNISSIACNLSFQWRVKYVIPISNYVQYVDSQYLESNDQMISAIIVWALTLATRQYRLGQPNFFKISYYCFGIYLFMVGLSAGHNL